MSQRLSFSTADHADLEVDLWGTVFVRVPITRARKRAFAELRAKLTTLDAETSRQQDALDPLDEGYAKATTDLEFACELDGIKLIGKLFDVVLAPVDAAQKKTKPSALILAKYEADEFTFADLDAFIERLAQAAAGPPT